MIMTDGRRRRRIYLCVRVFVFAVYVFDVGEARRGKARRVGTVREVTLLRKPQQQQKHQQKLACPRRLV